MRLLLCIWLASLRKQNISMYTKKEIEKIKYYHSLFPDNIETQISVADEGGFVVEISTFPGCCTQGETLSELIEMVNDAVATVLEVPKAYLAFMPTYLPPVSLAQRLNVFPSIKVMEESVTFSLKSC